MKKYIYQSAFAELAIKPIVSLEKDKCLAMASLNEIKAFLPDIDSQTNIDLLPVAFNACVVNRVNKNKDVIDTDTAIAMVSSFINKPINVEHNRQKVIGMILTAGFSEFGSDRILTTAQVKKMTGPFNITLGGVIWRVVCPELANHIEDSSDPTSDNYLSVSASWELGFTDYRIALLEGGEKNLSEAKQIISDPNEIENIKDKLTSLGGIGKVNDLFAYRMPSYDVLPLGIGFTEKPAAEVKGIATHQNDEVGIVIPEAFENKNPKDDKPKSISIPKSVKEEKIGIVNPEPFDKDGLIKNKISQSNISNVKLERKAHMKITSLKDITEDTLKECTASAVSEFIASELTKGSSEWEKQKNALNTQLTEAQANSDKLKSEYAQLQTQLKQVQATVDSLSSEKAEREKVEKFNVRMASVNEEYELDDEVRNALVDEIKSIASDEEFTKWQTRAKVLLKGFAKSKKVVDDKKLCDDKKSKADDMENEASKKAKASSATAAVISDAIDNGKQTTTGLPNSSAANEPSLKEKYKEAFARENFVIKI